MSSHVLSAFDPLRIQYARGHNMPNLIDAGSTWALAQARLLLDAWGDARQMARAAQRRHPFIGE